MERNRIYHLIFAIITIVIGLLARRYASYLPSIVNLGLGDALWALMMYWIVSFLFPQYSIKKIAIISLSICFIVEISQLYQADWINTIRNNRLGVLVLGRGFLWSDFLAYLLGVGIGGIVEHFIQNKKNRSSLE